MSRGPSVPHEQRLHHSVDNHELASSALALTEATPLYCVDDTELASSVPALSRGNIIISHFVRNQTTSSHGTPAASLSRRAQDYITWHTGRRAQQKGAGSHRRHTGRGRAQQRGAGTHHIITAHQLPCSLIQYSAPHSWNSSAGRMVLSRGKHRRGCQITIRYQLSSNSSSGRKVLSRGETRSWSLNRYSVPAPLERQYGSQAPVTSDKLPLCKLVGDGYR
jgi:hypothetical protein